MLKNTQTGLWLLPAGHTDYRDAMKDNDAL